MTSVWWCDSFVCECCECIQIEEIAKKCKTKNRLKEPQKISLTFKFFCNISPNTATRGFPEDIWRLEKNVFSRHLVCLRVSMCIYWRPRPSCIHVYLLKTPKSKSKKFFTYFLYYHIKEIYNIKKSSGKSRTYTQLNQNTGEDFLEKVFRFYASVFRVFRNTSSK